MVTIYIITNTIDGKVYVGQTRRSLAERWTDHKSAARNKADTPITAAIRELGPDAFTITTLAKADGHDADEIERFYIALLDSMNPARGYNMVSGGIRNYVPTQEVRNKMAAAHKASSATAAQIARMCAGNLGRKASGAHRQKIANALRGKTKSESWRRRISETKKAQAKKWTPEMRQKILASRARTIALRKAVA